MPSDQTPPPPGAMPPPASDQGDHDADFSQALAGESGDPIWESQPPQSGVGRGERARRAAREPEGKVPPGRLIDLERLDRPPGLTK